MVTVVLSLKSDEGEEEISYELSLESEEMAQVVINQVRFLLASEQVRREQRLSQVYKILIEYSDPGSGECSYSQDELAAAAGISPRHLRRQIKDLEARGLVVTKPRRLPYSPKTKNSYYLPHLAKALELLSIPDSLEAEAGTVLSSKSSSRRKAITAINPDNEKPIPHNKGNKSPRGKDASTKGQVHDQHLLFLDEAERRKRLRQSHCTPSYLQA